MIHSKLNRILAFQQTNMRSKGNEWNASFKVDNGLCPPVQWKCYDQQLAIQVSIQVFGWGNLGLPVAGVAVAAACAAAQGLRRGGGVGGGALSTHQNWRFTVRNPN